jgi:hypothetical protein
MSSRTEQRLAELEALRRPLTEEEGVDLRRCLHTLYMRHWRAELEMNEAALREYGIAPECAPELEVEPLARRMEAADCDSWRAPRMPKWEADARAASDLLRDTILRAQGKLERVAA